MNLTEVIPESDLPTAAPGPNDLVRGVRLSDGKSMKYGMAGLLNPEQMFFPDPFGPQTLSLATLENDKTVSILRFIPPQHHAGIKARTSTYDATASIQNALNSGVRSLRFDDGTYRITSTLTLKDKADFVLQSTGATIKIDAAAIGLDISGCDGLRFVGDLNLSGNAGATGFRITGTNNCDFSGLRCVGLAVGGILGINVFNNYGGNVVQGPVRVANIRVLQCGTGIRLDGEYYELVSPQISQCTGPGVHMRGGNNSISGGALLGNRIGLWVEGGGTNSDHGRISGASINHNFACGIYIANTRYSFHITGCDIWANIGDGTTNGQLTEEGKTTSFGCYFKNCENINLSANTIARNRVNIGIDGVVTSLISPNILMTDPLRTTSHIKEYGGAHDEFARNAQNIYNPNVFYGDLLGGGQVRVEVLNSLLSQGNRMKGAAGTTGFNYEVVATAATGQYDYLGAADTLVIYSDTAASVIVAPVLFATEFKVLFRSMGGSKTITLTGATGLLSLSAGAVVAGENVTFSQSGLYTFTPVGPRAWWITS